MSNLVGWFLSFNQTQAGGPYTNGRLYSSPAFPPLSKIESSVLVQPLRHVRFSPNSGWIVICENNYWGHGGAVNPPSDLISNITTGMEAIPPYTLLDVFFTPNNDWIIKWLLSDGSRKYQPSSNFSMDIANNINNLDTNGTTSELLCLAFPPPANLPAPSPTALTGNPPQSFWDSYIIICDNNRTFATPNAPSDITTKLKSLAGENFLLRSVVYSSATGWLITMANNSYWANGAFDQWLFTQIGQGITSLAPKGLVLGDVIIEVPVRNYTLQITTIDPTQVRSGFPSPEDTLYGQSSINVVNADTITSASPAPAVNQYFFGNFVKSNTIIGLGGYYPGYNPYNPPIITSPAPSPPPPQYALTVGPVQISDPRASVAFSFTFVNQGTGGPGELNSTEQTLAKFGAQAVSNAIGQLVSAVGTPALGSITSAILNEVSTLTFSNCDGLVAVETIAASGAALMALASSQLAAAQTPTAAIATQTTAYNSTNFPGSTYASASGSFCQAPNYVITWSIIEADTESPVSYGAPPSSSQALVLQETAGWPAGRTINNTDSMSKSAACALFLNQLYFFWNANDTTNNIWSSSSVDGFTWPNGHIVVNNATSMPVATCVYTNQRNMNQLYIFWTDAQTSKLFYSVCTDGSTWLTGAPINSVDTSSAGPAACVFQSASDSFPQLYLFWKANDPSNKIYFSQYAGTVDDNDLPSGANGTNWPGGQPWANGAVINNTSTTSVPPAACVFNGYLYLFWVPANSSAIYFSRADDPDPLFTPGEGGPPSETNYPGWPEGSPINSSDSTPASLEACVFQNQIFLFWKANDPSNAIYYTTTWDGQNWAPSATINGTDSTPQSLAAGVFQNQISIFWKANDSSNSIYTSASQRPIFMATPS